MAFPVLHLTLFLGQKAPVLAADLGFGFGNIRALNTGMPVAHRPVNRGYMQMLLP